MQNGEERAGWRVNEWAELVGIARRQVYRLIQAGDLKTAKVGDSRIILESPREFLERHIDDSLAV